MEEIKYVPIYKGIFNMTPEEYKEKYPEEVEDKDSEEGINYVEGDSSIRNRDMGRDVIHSSTEC